MATVNFLYRSTKKEAPLNIRLLFRYENKDFVFGAKTSLSISKHYWNKQHPLKRPKDIEVSNKQTEVNIELNLIENHILTAFNNVKPELIGKDWLRTQIEYYYNPPQQADPLPKDFINYIDSYTEAKGNDLTKNTVKKCNVIKQLVIRYQNDKKRVLLVSDINSHFKKDFETYCLKENYALSTISIAFKFIKTICNHAKSKGVETSAELQFVKSKNTKSKKIYLTFDELKKIENKTDLPEYLDNARDWLIISCYTGQRISDFMRFNKAMIRHEKNKDGVKKTLIEFTQQKTNKVMTVPVHSKVIEILEKRNGNFPRAISDQKYNDYIKDVCKLAKLKNRIKGSKKTETEPGNKIYRKASGSFEKWELITSHIGRRSFASNFYGTIPTTLLINVTGHGTEAMFLEYIGKSNKDLAMELSKYF